MIKKLSIICTFFLLSLNGSIFAQAKEAREPFVQEAISKIRKKPDKPYRCLFGVYPASLYDFNFAERSFKISFYAWWRTLDPDYHPEKSVEIVNAREYYSKFGQRGKNENEYFTYVHYYATIHHDWDVRYFPFDHQYLPVRLEDFADIQYVIFEPDDKQSNLHSELSTIGWNVLGMKLKDSVTHYTTNFGDKSVDKGLYSRLTFILELKRIGWRTYFNYFIGYFVSFFLCIMMYFVHPKNLEERANLSLGAIFTAVGNKYILDQMLPITPYFTLTDAIQTATFIMIVLAIMNFVVLQLIERKWKEKNVLKANYTLAAITSLIYVIFVGVFTYVAVKS